MTNDSHRKNSTLHTWLGVACGGLLFVEILVGSVVVFWKEIQLWQAPEHAKIVAPESGSFSLDSKVNQLISDESGILSLEIMLPKAEAPYLEISKTQLTNEGAPSRETKYFAVEQGSLREVKESEEGLAEFLFELHADLHLPWKLGHYLLGLLGMLMIVLIVSGVLIHKRVLKSLFNFRFTRSSRLKWTDVHNRLGIWGLPFHLIIAVTAVPYALHETPWLQLVSTGGSKGALSQQSVFEMFTPDVPQKTGVVRALSSIDEMLLDASKRQPSLQLIWLSIYNVNDEASRVIVRGRFPSEVSLAPSLVYDGGSGSYLRSSGDPVGKGTKWGAKLFSWVIHLHRGDFGGFVTKILWFFLGLSAAIMLVSGQLIWLERRQQQAHTPRERERLNQMRDLTSGVCGGLLVALACSTVAQQIVAYTEYSNGSWVALSFLCGWLSSAYLSLRIKNARQSTKFHALLSSFFFLSAVLSRSVFSTDSLLLAIQEQRWLIAGVDIALLGIAVFLLYVGIKLPSGLPEGAEVPVSDYQDEQEERRVNQ